MDNVFSSAILVLYPPFSKVYGPYVQKNNDGRRIIILRSSDGMQRTVSWPKAMMEVKLGRLLGREEFVDHIDDDPTNDCYGNFQVLTPQANNVKSIVARGAVAKILTLKCKMCGRDFSRPNRVVRRNQDVRKKAGPFCGKSCVGRYGTDVQRGRGAR